MSDTVSHAVIDLDALTADARVPRVRLFGREVPVYPLSGRAAHRLALMQADDPSGATLLGALLEVIRSSCPDLGPEEVDRLSVDQVAALVQLTRGQVTEVEAQLAAQIQQQQDAGREKS